MKLLYEGKAKQLFDAGVANEVYVHYKNSATAFNGEKQQNFEDKGKLNNTITSYIFQYLAQHGVATHFIKQVNDTDQICRHVDIIPLEVIMRNIVAGSMAKKYGLIEGQVLKQPVFELSYKNDALNDPLINDDHAQALGIVTAQELKIIKQQAQRINDLLQKLFNQLNLTLVDFKIEFGRLPDGEIILADEISPDTCRLWDKNDGEKMDKDRFRHDLGNLITAYQEVLRRLENAWN